MIERLIAGSVSFFARAVTGVRGNWQGCLPEPTPRIYYPNHTSHGDFVLIWSVLPAALRRKTRPVAGADYWLKDRFRHFVGDSVFHAVLIDRNPRARDSDPMGPLVSVLDAGNSLIFFPEGTRNTTEAPLLPFKTGLHHLAKARPGIEMVPVWIDNLNRVMPKGEVIPIPLLCTVTFGTPIRLAEGEDRQAFIARAREALLALAPAKEHDA